MKKLLFFMFCLCLAFEANAKNDFIVKIPVDVDAENSVTAKDLAMMQAQRQAFLDVCAKLTSADNVKKLSELTDDSILHFVQSVAVADEKAGGTKYKANLSVQINEQLLKDYLAENEMIEAESAEFLVIPVYQASNNSYPELWENSNLWRQNWRSKGLIKFGTMQIRTIGEHFRDIEQLDAENAIYMNSSLFNQIAQLNGSERIYVLYAQTMPNGDLKITVKNERNKQENVFTVYNDDESNVFDKAIEKSVMFISNMEREARGQETASSVGTINAVYEYHNMKDWLEKSKSMAALDQVEGIDTKSFGGGKVNFSIRYNGSLDDLWAAMQEIDLSHETAGNYYIIR